MERKLTILIAQKYYDPGQGFRELLEKSGYHTVSLSSHSEIFELLAQKRVDMVIVGVTTTIEYYNAPGKLDQEIGVVKV